MANVTKLIINHPLVGTWTCEGDDSSAEFTIVSKGASLSVSGRDRNDGEAFQISDVAWDGESLAFSSLMASTGNRVRHVMRALPDGSLEHEYTLTERWQRR